MVIWRSNRSSFHCILGIDTEWRSGGRSFHSVFWALMVIGALVDRGSVSEEDIGSWAKKLLI